MTTSFWLDRDAARPGVGPLQGDARADVAIIGGGIAGIACALALVRSGASVIVLERDRVAVGASGRNAGFVLGGVAESFAAACRRYGAERALRIVQVTFNARALIRAAITEAGIECDDRWDGSDQLAGDDLEWSELAASAARLSGHGVRVTVDPTERRITFPDDGCLDPVRFVRGLAAAAARGGARLHEGTAVTAVTSQTVTTAGGSVIAGTVVLCTGGYTARLAPARIRAVRGQMLATAPVEPGRYPRPTYANRGYRYWRQAADGSVLVGGWRDLAPETEIGEDDATSPAIQDALDQWLRSEGITAPVTHRWGGTMDFSHDGLPYIGRRADGLYLCGGFTGHGNGFAMAAAQILAAVVKTGHHPDADLFDPERD
ncbi:MAG TPA: FAD-dependent oxidoreductase [Candidatus Saccharimonadales bacterium]|nr:FAD-dependent oxidoreductase [Candidatus Saccharimonadales bacterium]